MKHYSYYRMLVLCVAAVSLQAVWSCGRIQQDGSVQAKMPVSITADVEPPVRAAGTSFEDGDEIGLTLVRWQGDTPASLSGFRDEDNVRYGYSGTAFSAVSAAYWPDTGSKNTLYAYYPYNDSGFVSGESTIEVSVSSSQDDIDEYKASDFMFASSEGVVATEEAVPMTFAHVLSKVNVVIGGGGIPSDELAGASVVIRHMHLSASYDAASSSFTFAPYWGDISMCRENDGFSAIVIPQTVAEGELLFRITAGGKTYLCYAEKDLVFASGTVNEFNVTLASDETRMMSVARSYSWNR